MPLRSGAKAKSFCRAYPSVGNVVARTLIAELPEFGTLDRRKIIALVGVAPFSRDSGTMPGRRTACGGRASVRTALYNGHTCRLPPQSVIAAFYQRLMPAGKCKSLRFQGAFVVSAATNVDGDPARPPSEQRLVQRPLVYNPHALSDGEPDAVLRGSFEDATRLVEAVAGVEHSLDPMFGDIR